MYKKIGKNKFLDLNKCFCHPYLSKNMVYKLAILIFSKNNLNID